MHGLLLVGGREALQDAAGPGRRRGRGGRCELTEIAPEALTADFGVDAVRYHLLRDVPLGTDGDFSYEGIVVRYNADLANNLGNLISRVATVVGSKCGGIGPAPDPAEPAGRRPPSGRRPAAAAPGNGSPPTRRSRRPGG